MKPIVRSLLLPFLFSCVVSSASAQIRDDESSQTVLAVQCAVSSGFSASEFEDYSRRLAKTLSLLTSNQQKKVFGYLPQPAAVSSNEAEATPAAVPAVVPAAVSPDRGGIKEADPGLLVGHPRDTGSDPVSAGSAVSSIVKGGTEADLEKAATSIAGSRNGNSSWSAILSWLSSLAAKARNR